MGNAAGTEGVVYGIRYAALHAPEHGVEKGRVFPEQGGARRGQPGAHVLEGIHQTVGQTYRAEQCAQKSRCTAECKQCGALEAKVDAETRKEGKKAQDHNKPCA